MLEGGDGQQHLLIRSDKTTTGYKGVIACHGRYQARCTTLLCHQNHLGTFDTPEDAAQSYLQHQQEKHPKELKKERAPRQPPPVLRQVQEHLLIRSDKGKSGYKGVTANNNGRYYANCTTPPCHSNYLGYFRISEDAAQAYLQHQQQEHEHAAELKDVKPPAEEEEEEEGRAVSTDKGKKRNQQPQPTSELERLADQLHGENQALKRCKQESGGHFGYF